MYNLLKPLLFLLPAEKAHYFTLSLLKFTLNIPIVSTLFKNFYTIKSEKLNRKLMGLTFPNPVGLAAGFDKDGKSFREMASLGFGFIELGTVTPKPQSGNPTPRLFRLPADEALINRMGFNNDGVEALVNRLKKGTPENLVIGGNIGKNKITPNEKAVDDYTYCFEQLFPYVDYFVVNVSSPNTPNLRALQDKEPLTQLLSTLQTVNQQKSTPKPILLKIAPDLSNAQLDDIIEIIGRTKLDGLIATNTTINRDHLQTSDEKIRNIGAGGLSGAPLTQRSFEILRYLKERLSKNTIIISVGGINSPEEVLKRLKAGADLIQIYTGLVYEGPGIVKRINKRLLKTQNA